MESLRTSRIIGRLVLAWFVLFVGASVAAPLIQPSSVQLICSASGVSKLVVSDRDGNAQDQSSMNMECPLCLTVGAPPLLQPTTWLKASPLAYALQPIAAAHIASVTAPPLPSRGPPSSAV